MIDTADLAAELVFRQRQSEETYRKLEAQFQADFAKIEWPIAFLNRHYDPEDVVDSLSDTVADGWTDDELMDMAMELVS
jgi:hypothetical protein